MKLNKYIIITIITCFCFTQELGMINKNLGVYIGAQKPLSCDDCDPELHLGVSYLLKDSYEFGLSYEENNEKLGVSIDYHIKSYPFNISFGIENFSYEYEYSSSYYYDSEYLGGCSSWEEYGVDCGWVDYYAYEYYTESVNRTMINVNMYNSKGLYFGASRNMDTERKYLTVGKAFRFGPTSFFFDYKLNSEFDDIDEGNLTFKILFSF